MDMLYFTKGLIAKYALADYIPLMIGYSLAKVKAIQNAAGGGMK